jgi:molecular chaperone IbpA
MTNTLTLRSLDIPSIHKFGLGFDSMFNDLMRVSQQQTNPNYPPYNIWKKNDTEFGIEIAVAGFSEGDINIQLDNRVLTVTGSKTKDLDKPESDEVEYVHRGISARNFERTFTLAEHVEVVSATVKDGILDIDLELRLPEEKKPKQIAITYTK